MRNTGLDKLQAGIKIGGRNINSLRYVDDTTLMAKNEEELKNLLMRVKEESEKAGLKLNIKKKKTNKQTNKKTDIITFNTITSRQIEEEKVEAVEDFSSWAPNSLWMVTAGMKSQDCFLAAKL